MKLLVLTVPSTAYAATVSGLMWGLCSPGGGSGSTQYLYSWTTHPGQHDGPAPVALLVGDGRFYIQPDATADAIIAAASLSQPEADQLSADIEAARGGMVNVEDLLPPSIAANLLTQQEATDAGWFDDSSL